MDELSGLQSIAPVHTIVAAFGRTGLDGWKADRKQSRQGPNVPNGSARASPPTARSISGFHDLIVHKRIAHRYLTRSTYMKRIVQAHRLHHAVETKEGTVSFGFLWAPPAEDLEVELAKRGRAGVRAPAKG